MSRYAIIAGDYWTPEKHKAVTKWYPTKRELMEDVDPEPIGEFEVVREGEITVQPVRLVEDGELTSGLLVTDFRSEAK